MSDYVHKKAVRLPFPIEILILCNTDDAYECENYLKNLLDDLWMNDEKNSFFIESTDNAVYIDWVYHYTYGEESGDWGNVRVLSDNELKIIKPYFDKLLVEYKDDDLRVIDYCYYNCCEPTDYYNINNDDSLKFIN